MPLEIQNEKKNTHTLCAYVRKDSNYTKLKMEKKMYLRRRKKVLHSQRHHLNR